MKLDRIMFWIWITNQYLKNGYPYEMILYCGKRSLFLNNSYMANVNVTEDPSTIFKFPLFFFLGGGGVFGIFKFSIFLHSIRSICHISGPNRPFSLNKSYMANVNLQRIQVQFSSFLFFNFFYVRIFKLSLLLYSVRSICHISGPRYAPLSLP